MTKPNYKQKALDHVRSVCSELMELSFGCRFHDSLKNQGTVTHVTDFVSKKLPYDIHFVMDDNKTDSEEAASEWFEEEITIIGHTPHLEHWLRGIQGDDEDTIFIFDDVRVDSNGIYFPKYNLFWNTVRDGENQSEEFYKSYCQIVGV